MISSTLAQVGPTQQRTTLWMHLSATSVLRGLTARQGLTRLTSVPMASTAPKVQLTTRTILAPVVLPLEPIFQRVAA